MIDKKDIGNYVVYSNGKVWNKILNRFMTLCKHPNGYLQVWIAPKRKLHHRLIAECFIPNPNNKPWINHIDGNKQNNTIDNLEWVTSSENRKHALETKLAIPKKHTEETKLKQSKSMKLHFLNKKHS
jgi:hypothetical protein